MPRFLLTLAVIGLAVYALSDLARTRSDQTGGIPKWFWAIILVLVPVIGPLAWIVFRRTGSTPPRGRGPARGAQGPRRGGGPVAPDDDPEFLRRLDQARREQARREQERGEQERRGHDDDADPTEPRQP